jgi:hypothetical protein
MSASELLGDWKHRLAAKANDASNHGRKAGYIPFLESHHLHCVVPGGGLSPDGLRWIGCKKKSFFLPVKVLSCRFRNLFLTYLGKAFEAGRLAFHGEVAGLAAIGV